MVVQKFTNKNCAIDKIISIILFASIIASSAILIYILLTPKTGEKFTEFYILDSNGTSSNYPTDLKIGEEGKVIIGIVNNEYENITYYLEVNFNGSLIYKENIFLIESKKWENQLTFKATKKGDNQKLVFLLYKTKQIEVYRTLYLFVRII